VSVIRLVTAAVADGTRSKVESPGRARYAEVGVGLVGYGTEVAGQPAVQVPRSRSQSRSSWAHGGE
jgi:hypothetical protein